MNAPLRAVPLLRFTDQQIQRTVCCHVHAGLGMSRGKVTWLYKAVAIRDCRDECVFTTVSSRDYGLLRQVLVHGLWSNIIGKGSNQ